MLYTVLALGLSLSPAAALPLKQAPALEKSLLEAEAVYTSLEAKEEKFSGVLEFSPSTGLIGIPPGFNAYTLKWTEGGKIFSRPIHMDGKDSLLAPFVGHKVDFHGKIREREIAGEKILELVPGRVSVLGRMPYGVLGDVRILARTTVALGGVIRQGFQPEVFLIRDGEDLAAKMNYAGTNAAAAATNAVSQRLGLAIDWQKHMLLNIRAGQQRVAGARVVVTSATIGADGITIRWKLELPNNPGISITYPQETIVLPATNAEVRVYQEGGRAEPVVFPAVKN